MPYIDPARRDVIELAPTGLLAPKEIQTVGELNFAISRLMTAFIKNSGGVSYGSCAAARAACHDAAEELYRRVVAPYEDKKCLENGDVYGDVHAPPVDLGGEA